MDSGSMLTKKQSKFLLQYVTIETLPKKITKNDGQFKSKGKILTHYILWSVECATFLIQLLLLYIITIYGLHNPSHSKLLALCCYHKKYN